MRDRYQDHLASEKGDLRKVVWQGGGSISELAAQWETGKSMLPGGGSKKDDCDEGTPEESEEDKELSVENMVIT